VVEKKKNNVAMTNRGVGKHCGTVQLTWPMRKELTQPLRGTVSLDIEWQKVILYGAIKH
jgi:hypothetical protein